MDYEDCFLQNGWSLEDYVEEYLELYHEAPWDNQSLKTKFLERDGRYYCPDAAVEGGTRPFHRVC